MPSLFGGDLIDAHLSFVLCDGSYRHLQDLKAPLGIWSVFGNRLFDGDIEEEKRPFPSVTSCAVPVRSWPRA